MGNQQETNWVVYTDGAIKTIDVKRPELIKGANTSDTYNKHDLTKGAKELEALNESHEG